MKFMRKNLCGKNLQTYRKLNLLVAILMFTSTLFAQDFLDPPPFQLSIHPTLGYRTGSIGEYVFSSDVKGTATSVAPEGTKKLSFLAWDVHALVVAGLELNMQYKSFLTQVYGEIGSPFSTGKMDDFDWDSTKGYLTNFSTHHNKITQHFILKGLIGWEFSSANRKLQFIPMVGGSWQETDMTGYDGYGQYVPETSRETTPWTDDIEKQYFKGNLITYRHVVYQIDCLLRLQYNFNQKFTLKFDSIFSPIIGVYGYDTHILRNKQFLDYNMNGQIGFGTAIGLDYQILPKHWLTLKINYDYLPVVTGKTYSKSTNELYYYPQHGTSGGASHWFVGVTLGWKFNFFK